VRDIALAQPGAPHRPPDQDPAVTERVDNHRPATVWLVGGLAFDRGTAAQCPLGGRVDVIDIQVDDYVAELRARLLALPRAGAADG